MTDYYLVPHPDFPSRALTEIRVTVERRGDGIEFWFWLSGDLDQVAWPAGNSDEIRADNLWKHTCFEAFGRVERQKAYSEFNWCPHVGWAAYAFDSYRSGMRNIENRDGRPVVGGGYHSVFDDGYVLSFLVDDIFDRNAVLSLGLTAVIEAADGTKSYWALAHPPGKPDFHNADCFTARLAAPERA
jgi:hypothetical protein